MSLEVFKVRLTLPVFFFCFCLRSILFLRLPKDWVCAAREAQRRSPEKDSTTKAAKQFAGGDV